MLLNDPPSPRQFSSLCVVVSQWEQVPASALTGEIPELELHRMPNSAVIWQQRR